jgi:RNA recognition motif. (a.k.a. RRM, RBD, or RNP domain)
LSYLGPLHVAARSSDCVASCSADAEVFTSLTTDFTRLCCCTASTNSVIDRHLGHDSLLVDLPWLWQQILLRSLSRRAVIACRGNAKKTKGTAFVVYEDIFDAKRAQEGLSGFNVQNRYLIVLYWNQKRQQQHLSTKQEEEELKAMQQKYGVDGEQHARKAQGSTSAAK